MMYCVYQVISGGGGLLTVFWCAGDLRGSSNDLEVMVFLLG